MGFFPGFAAINTTFSKQMNETLHLMRDISMSHESNIPVVFHVIMPRCFN